MTTPAIYQQPLSVTPSGVPEQLWGGTAEGQGILYYNTDPASTVYLGYVRSIKTAGANTIALGPQQSFIIDGGIPVWMTGAKSQYGVEILPGATSASPTSLSISGPVTADISGTVDVSVQNTSLNVDVTNSVLDVSVTGTADVSVQGTANVSLTGSNAVTISGTPTVDIGNTPSVTISGTPNVAITGTPTVTVSSGTVNATVSGNVGITGTPAVTISGTPTVDIGNTPSVTISGTPTVDIGTVSGSIDINTVAGNVNVTGTGGYVLPGAYTAILNDTSGHSVTYASPTYTTSIYNVQNYQSFSLAVKAYCTAQTSAGAPLTLAIQVNWYANSGGTYLLESDIYWMWVANNSGSGNANPLLGGGPARGAYMSVTFINQGANANTVDITLISINGNGRSLASPKFSQSVPNMSSGITIYPSLNPVVLISGYPNGSDGILANETQNGSANASSEYWFPMPLYTGPVRVIQAVR